MLQFEIFFRYTVLRDDINLSSISRVNISFSRRAQRVLDQFNGLLQWQGDWTVDDLVSSSNLTKAQLNMDLFLIVEFCHSIHIIHENSLGYRAKAGSIQLQIRMLSMRLFHKNQQHHMNIRILFLIFLVRTCLPLCWNLPCSSIPPNTLKV